MSTVIATSVLPDSTANDILTIGATGDSVAISGDSLNLNTLQDAGGNTVVVSNGSGVITSSGFAGAMILISSQTVTNQASVSFTTGLDSTYDVYVFKFYDINSATDGAKFEFQGNTVGGSGYNETITSSFFSAYHDEADGNTDLQYETSRDQAQGTAYQYLIGGVGSGADECCAGELYLFAPSSTTYVKNFYSRVIEYYYVDYAIDNFCAGYFNVTAAIDDIQFKMDSGNFDGTIALYGISKS